MRYYIIGEQDWCGIEEIGHRMHIRTELARKGHTIVNQQILEHLSVDISDREVLKMRLDLIYMSDAIFVVDGWKKAKFSQSEVLYAKSLGKEIHFETKQWSLRKGKEKDGAEV